MYINNYIQIALYFPLAFVLINLLSFTPKSIFFKKFKLLFGLLFFITFIGLIKGTIYGIYLGKKMQYINEDILKLVAFLFFIGFPFYIIAQKENLVYFFNKYFNYFAFIYTILVSLSLFIVGNNDETNYSIYPGNLFGASTVNLIIISAWSFYSIAQYSFTKKKFFLYWSLLCFLDVLISLAKWNFIAIISYPMIITLVLNAGNSFTKFQKKLLIVVFSIAVSVFFYNLNSILAPVAQARGWDSFDDFLYGRVFGEAGNNDNLGKAISFGGDSGIKDGARLIMWADLISRTIENPIMGVGLGTRALDNTGLFIEDHNIFITHISRYGLPLFLMWLWLVFLTIKLLRTYITKIGKSKVIRYVFAIMYVNFFFQASVGNIWGQVLVVLSIGSSIGLMLFLNNKLYTNNTI